MAPRVWGAQVVYVDKEAVYWVNSNARSATNPSNHHDIPAAFA